MAVQTQALAFDAQQLSQNLRSQVDQLNSTNIILSDVSYHRGYLSGNTLSAPGGAQTLTITAGVCADSTNAVLMKLASTYTKTMASWAVGSTNGGLDTGSVATSTWYHFRISCSAAGTIKLQVASANGSLGTAVSSSTDVPTGVNLQVCTQIFPRSNVAVTTIIDRTSYVAATQRI